MRLALPARAKLNLDLRIIGRTADGYHELVSTMLSIELHDLLEVSPTEDTLLTTGGLKLEVGGAGGGAENSVLRAQTALERAAKRRLPAWFHLHKRIPPGSGMGGASSDAAAALIALKTLYRLDVDLAPVAAEVGADVPFFLRGGRARVQGRGERLTPLPMIDAWFAIAWPGIELSTASVYRAWDEVRGEPPNDLRRAAETVDPRIRDFATKTLKDSAWQMTGSGSAFFKRCESEEQARREAASLEGWTAVTTAVGPWA